MQLEAQESLQIKMARKDQIDNTIKVAALDLGSNTCRLIIATIFQDGTFEPVEIFSRIVRLGENLSRSNKLESAAIERTLGALRTCARKIEEHQPALVRCVATEACRRAHNADHFRKLVRLETRLRLEIIDPGEEAELCLKGCEDLLNPLIPYAIVFDIGGGSSEVMWVKVHETGEIELLELISMPFGVVGLSETYGAYTGVVFEDIVRSIGNALKEFKAFDTIHSFIQENKVQMVGCSGTATTIAALKLDLKSYDRSVIDGTIIKREDIEKIKNKLCEMTQIERANHPCIGSGRSDLVIPGLSIFAGIYDTFSVKEMCVADRGVRDGIIATFAQDTVLSRQKEKESA